MSKLTRALSITVAAVAIIGASGSAYQPRETFAPFDMGQPVNVYRSPNGLPGPGYWQNRADYVIRATLDTATKTISGTTVITYRNNSPDALDALWLQLDQNMYRPNSRGALSRGGRSRGNTDGMTLDAATVAIAGKPVTVTPTISDTRPTAASHRPPRACHRGGHDPLSLHRARRVRRPHRLGAVARRRDLRCRAMVSAHGGL